MSQITNQITNQILKSQITWSPNQIKSQIILPKLAIFKTV